MKRSKNEIAKKFTEELQLPESAVTNSFRIEFRGTADVVIEGCKGIIEYEEYCIALNLGKNIVRFFGADLEISSFFEEQAILKGTVLSMEYSS